MTNEDLASLLSDMVARLEENSSDSKGTKALIEEINKLRDSLNELDKEVRNDKEQFIVLRERFSGLISQYQELRNEIEELQDNETKNNDKRSQAVEKIFMVILGAVVSYIASLLSK